mgnify:CR=1 FL=1
MTSKLPRQFYTSDKASCPEGLRSALQALKQTPTVAEEYSRQTFDTLALLGRTVRGATTLVANHLTEGKAPHWTFNEKEHSLVYQMPNCLSWTLQDYIAYYRRVTILTGRNGEGGIFTVMSQDIHADSGEALNSLAVGFASSSRMKNIKTINDLGSIRHVGYTQTTVGDFLPYKSPGAIHSSERTIAWIKPYDKTYKLPTNSFGKPDMRPPITLYYEHAFYAATMLANLALTSVDLAE